MFYHFDLGILDKSYFVGDRQVIRSWSSTASQIHKEKENLAAFITGYYFKIVDFPKQLWI